MASSGKALSEASIFCVDPQSQIGHGPAIPAAFERRCHPAPSACRFTPIDEESPSRKAQQIAGGALLARAAVDSCDALDQPRRLQVARWRLSVARLISAVIGPSAPCDGKAPIPSVEAVTEVQEHDLRLWAFRPPGAGWPQFVRHGSWFAPPPQNRWQLRRAAS